MRLCLWSGLSSAVLGWLILFDLNQKKEALAVEVEKTETSFQRRLEQSRRSQVAVLNLEEVLRKNEEFEGGYPERFTKLYDLPLEELRAAASWILSTQTAPYEGIGELPGQHAVLDLVKELDPEWVLQELEKREVGKKFPRHSRALAPQAFATFLRKDRRRALQWFEAGYGKRTFEFFNTGALESLVVGEYLKSDPQRAIEIYEAAIGRVPGRVNFPSFARLENTEQLAVCVEIFRQATNFYTKNALQKIIARETYRLSGVPGMRELLGSVEFRVSTDLGNFEILGTITENFESEAELRGLLELAGEAPLEIRERALAWVAGGWAYYDAPAAELVMREMPQGEARQLAFERLIRCKSEYDSDRGYELLSEIVDEEKRRELRKIIDKRGGEL